MADSLKKTAEKWLLEADIRINGKREWDIQVLDESVYQKVLSGGSFALGETYMEGLWESKAIDQFISKILKAGLDKKLRVSKEIVWNYLKSKIINPQRKSRAHIIGERHYDIGNDLYSNMLDKRMIYSCGYWRHAKTLDLAQEAKLDLICKKIRLKPGMSVLDIGCGWGGFAKFAAEKYKAKVVGITVSKEQAKYAKEACKGLDIEIRLEDYRSLDEKFDSIVSIGMFEHVGVKNYRKYMNIVNRCLKKDGIFLLHTIGGNHSVTSSDAWLGKYIFPNSMLPSAKQITKASEGIFRLEDWHNFGNDYDKTLLVWHKNFNKNWGKIKNNYDERFFRMWNYYLLSCAASFRERKINLWQIVFTKTDSDMYYESVR